MSSLALVKMESYFLEDFGDVKPKNSSEEALQRWRKLCWVVKNPKRRFRFTANLSKRNEADAIRRSNQEKFRVAVLVSQAALQFIHGLNLISEYSVPEEVKDAGFEICADELGTIVEGRDVKKLTIHGGVEGIAGKLSTSPSSGIPTSEQLLCKRKEIYGINKFTESPVKGFLTFVWEALQDMTLMILGVCAFVSLIVGIVMEGWPKGAHDGLGIVASILLVVFVTATSDYRQSLQFKDLDREKKKIVVQVTRDGCRQKISIYDLLPGDIVHLSIGDQVPADGLFLSGFSVVINESSLTGESEPVNANSQNPFLLSGTKVQDGSCKMLVTTVGMRTQWGKLMATLSEGGDDETPLQVKLNGVATIIGKIDSALKIFIQSIFNNTGGEVVTNKDGKTELLGSPTETALLEFGLTLGGDFQAERQASTIVKVEPFNSTKKRMGVVLELPDGGFRAHCKGASEIVLAACDKVVDLKGDVVPLDEAYQNILTNTIEQFANEALRTLCLCYMEVMARSSPLDKHTLVKHLRTTFQEVVAVTGDGTNDAPALHEADIGLAMGIAGTEVAKESADVIILDDNFSTIVTVGKWGRSVYINIQKFVQFQLTVNVVALIVNFSSACLTVTFQLNGPDCDLILNTIIFNSFVFCQAFNEISSREMEKINVFKGIMQNYVFVSVLSCTIIFQIIIVEFLGTFASTSPLSLQQWVVSVILGFLGMPVAAALKMIPVGSK
ncbi:hypothetical protein G4B88_015910 [Cannabis sativa]|uniref:Calcium-transporting ATPase n=2 Tax=Cannabis sativa TaxID=3483 RepID=A0A7J6ESE7_CANSA|nr:hypothetical protein G4B88_015910 [Cannabis sativa]